MKRTFFSAFLLLAFSSLFAQTKGNSGKIKIIAHRGGTTERPENTISAYKRAVELGADMLEIDVRTSSDGVLFILHDTSLDPHYKWPWNCNRPNHGRTWQTGCWIVVW